MIKPIFCALFTLALVGCAGTPAISPSPSPVGSPRPGATAGETPSETSSLSPRPTTTRSPTTTPSPTFGEGEISHPTGTDEVVLQMETGGGFMPPEVLAIEAPQFTLYGDGTVIFRPSHDAGRIGPVDGLPRFLQGRMNEEAVQALLRFALGQGRLLEAREFYGHDGIADAPTTIFRLNAAGVSKTVSVYALGIVEEAGPDAADRHGFAALADTLNRFEEQVASGALGEVELYDPSLYRVVLTEAQQGMGEPIEWPWDGLTIDDFRPRGEGGWQREAAVARDEVAELTEVPSGGVSGIFVADGEGGFWTLSLRPLLPDEIAGE